MTVLRFRFTAVITSIICQSSFASGIPTVDVANILQTTTSALENIEQTANQVQQIRNQVDSLRNQVEQINQLNRQFESITGSYNMGQLLNSQVDRNARRYIPRSWQETLAILEAGGLPGYQTEAQDAAQEAREQGERYTATDIYAESDWEEAQRYIRQARRIFSTMGASQAAYNSTEERYQNIEQLNDQIDTATDLKAAQDLQNRLMVENAAYMNELIRQVSVLNIQQTEVREDQHNRQAEDKRASNSTLNYEW